MCIGDGGGVGTRLGINLGALTFDSMGTSGRRTRAKKIGACQSNSFCVFFYIRFALRC